MLYPVINKSENRVLQELENSEYKKKYRIFPQLRMEDVIQGGPTKLGLRGKEKKHYQETTFDYVICDLRNVPLFVIEFDGCKEHFNQEEQKKSDIRKVSICKRFGLPIIRIDETYFDKIFEASVIKYIIKKSFDWENNKDNYEREFQLFLKSYSEKQIEEMAKDGDLVGSYDQFNMDHRYSILEPLKLELQTQYNVFNSNTSFNTPHSNYSYQGSIQLFNENEPEYISYLYRYTFSGKLLKEHKEEPFSYPISEESKVRGRLKEKIESIKIDGYEISGYTSHYLGIPGVDIFDLAETISNYKCLKRIEEICREKIESGWRFA